MNTPIRCYLCGSTGKIVTMNDGETPICENCANHLEGKIDLDAWGEYQDEYDPEHPDHERIIRKED